MLYRYTIALVLVAVTAGACSQSQQETIVSETAVSSTVVSAVPPAETVSSVPASTTILESEVSQSSASSSTVPSSTTIPEVEFSPIATLPATTVSPISEVIEVDGVAMFASDLTVGAAELVGVAVEACRGAGVDPFGSGCAGAVWEACYGVRSDIEKIRVTMGDRWDALGSDQRDAFSHIGRTLCSAAFTAEVVELAAVLAASYGGRYYRESRSIVDEERWRNDYESAGYATSFDGPTRFRGDLRDFADFRRYIERGDWAYASEITPDLNEEYLLAEYVSEAAYAVIKPLLKVLGRNVRYYSLRYSSMSPAEFDPDAVIRSAQEEERIGEGARFSIGDLPSSPEDISVLCYDAVYAARISRNGWENDIESCTVAAEGCVETQEDHPRRCEGILIVAREAGLELMWQRLPAVCASSEDIIYFNPDDTCRRAAFDAYVYSGASLKKESRYTPYNSAKNLEIREAVFYLSQPLILSNLPQHQRINDARIIEEE